MIRSIQILGSVLGPPVFGKLPNSARPPSTLFLKLFAHVGQEGSLGPLRRQIITILMPSCCPEKICMYLYVYMSIYTSTFICADVYM